MNKYLLLFLILPLFFSCKNKEIQIKALQAKNDSLTTINNQKDKEINDYVLSLNQIQENLQTIKETEKLVTLNAKGDVEKKQGTKEKIESDVQLIYQLMENNRKALVELNYKLHKSDNKISEFGKTIEFLSKRIQEDSAEMNTIMKQLESKNIVIKGLKASLDTLNTVTKNQSQVINQQTEKLNTAYYVIGTEKELRDHKILTKEGGFIGIGKNNKVLNNFDRSYFTKINIQNVTTIKLGVKKAKIITTHPSTSYRFDQTGKTFDNLVITNIDDFWSASRYLVLIVDK